MYKPPYHALHSDTTLHISDPHPLLVPFDQGDDVPIPSADPLHGSSPSCMFVVWQCFAPKVKNYSKIFLVVSRHFAMLK